MKVKEAQATYKVYVADDGEEFGSEKECRDYEDGIAQEKAEAEVEKLPQFFADHPYNPGHDDDPEWRWLYLRSQQDLDNVKAAFYCRDCTARSYEIKAFPCWVLATIDEDGYGQLVTFDEFVEDQDGFVTSLLADMERLVPKEVNQ